MKQKIVCVYKYETPDGHIYIGATVDYIRRLKQYKINKCKTQPLITNQINVWGFCEDMFSILEVCDISNIYEREIYFIDKYNSFFYKNPNGLNLTIGGKGANGVVVSDKQKALISDNNSKEVHQYDRRGEYIKSYKSATLAAKECGLDLASLCQAANGFRGKKMCGNFGWSYNKLDSLDIKYNTTFRERIVQLDKSLIIISVYENILEASRLTGITASNISNVINGKRISAGGCYWDTEYHYNNIGFSIKKEKQKIFKTKKCISFSIDGKRLMEFNSITDAAKHYNISCSDIVSCCKGKAKTVKKMIFRYSNNGA